MNSDENISNENALVKHDMTYIKKVLSLNKKEFNKYIFNYEKHLIVTIEKLKNKMFDLIIYVHRANKRLRD